MKKVAVLNDLSGFGRCSLTAAIPVISTLGLQCCPMPTAILSNQTGYPSYTIDDMTERLPAYMEEWKKLNPHFDGILTGYLADEKQVSMILKFIDEFKTEDTLLVVDPVMADDGAIYPCFDHRIVEQMKKLVACANVITPNLSEFCFLSGLNYHDLLELDSKALLNVLKINARKLMNDELKKIIITSVHLEEDTISNVIIYKDQLDIVTNEKHGGSYSGTGDLFVSVITGCLVKGLAVVEACEKASRFIEKSIIDTLKDETYSDRNDGIYFELNLKELL